MNNNSLACKAVQYYQCATGLAEKLLLPVTLLVARLVVALAFFKAGQVKIANWDSTLFLFEYEYQVPIIPYELAAYMGTATELLIPPLLALGLIGRPAAVVLFFFNIIAVVSYPAIWEGGFYDHQLWGFMLLTLVVLGPGKLSVDHFLGKKFFGKH